MLAGFEQSFGLQAELCSQAKISWASVKSAKKFPVCEQLPKTSKNFGSAVPMLAPLSRVRLNTWAQGTKCSILASLAKFDVTPFSSSCARIQPSLLSRVVMATAQEASILAELPGDVFVQLSDSLDYRDFVSMSATCHAMQQAVRLNERLWTSLYSHQFKAPLKDLSKVGLHGESWYSRFLQNHTACHQLISTQPSVRAWSTDSSPVALAQIHGSGHRRLVLTAQQNILEVRCAPPGDASFQLYGHNGRVSCAALLDLAGDRLGVVSGSADQTLRLWQARLPASTAGEHGDEAGQAPQPPAGITLLTPARTLRGHQESVTCLHVLTGTSGVSIAATGGKDRVIKLWGLAPLLPSPVHQPLIATLRGHGATITALATLPFSPEGQAEAGGPAAAAAPAASLISSSLDGRLKQWDCWNPACVATAKLPAPAVLLSGLADPLSLLPAGLAQYCVVAAGANAVHAVDVRSMRVTQLAQQPERAGQVLCMAQWGAEVVTGGRDGARVWDLRMAGCGAEPRLLLRDHSRQITSVHMDRLKLVVATGEFGDAPVRVWCHESGRLLARLGSTPPPPAQDHSQQGEGMAGPGGDERAGEKADGAWSEEEGRPGWEGISAMAVQGAVLVTGNSEGLVCERDYSRGGLPGQGRERGEQPSGAQQLGKFWQALDLR